MWWLFQLQLKMQLMIMDIKWQEMIMETYLLGSTYLLNSVEVPRPHLLVIHYFD